MTWQRPGFWQPAGPGTVEVTSYAAYTIGRLTWREAWRAARGKPVTLDAARVSGHLPVVAGRLRIEAFGGGAGSSNVIDQAAQQGASTVITSREPCDCDDGRRRRCCGTRQLALHDSGCPLTPAQRDGMADHERMFAHDTEDHDPLDGTS